MKETPRGRDDKKRHDKNLFDDERFISIASRVVCLFLSTYRPGGGGGGGGTSTVFPPISVIGGLARSMPSAATGGIAGGGVAVAAPIAAPIGAPIPPTRTCAPPKPPKP